MESASSITGGLLFSKQKDGHTAIRLAMCRECIESTWLLPADYTSWLIKHGIEVIKNFNDLSALPKLEKKEYQKNAKLFCRICKCWLPAKSYVKNEQCPLNKWSNENG